MKRSVSERPNVVITRNSEGVTILVPPARVPTHLAILLGGLLFWAPVGWSNQELLRRAVLEGPRSLPDAIILCLVFVWLLFGVNGLSALLWEMFGQERLCVAASSLAVEWSICGLRHKSSYPIRDVFNLRLNFPPVIVRGWFLGRASLGAIAFNGGGRQRYFGQALDRETAIEVLRVLHEGGLKNGV